MNELVDDHDMSVFPGFLRSGFIIDEPRTFMWSSEILLKLGSGPWYVYVCLDVVCGVCVCVPRFLLCIDTYPLGHGTRFLCLDRE
jgi:hypothetical protein